MNGVQSFTFFDGYFEAIKDLNDKDKKDVLLAITEYVIEGKEPNYKGIKKSLWALIKPTLDKSIVRSKAKQNKNKLKSKQNQNEIKTKSNQEENEIKSEQCPLLEKEKEIEVEIEDINSSCSSNNNYSAEREKEEQQLQQLFINCTSSTNLQAISECISYLDDFPFEVIEIALKKTSEKNGGWKYAKTILQNWIGSGIKTVEQVQAEEINFKTSKSKQDKFEYTQNSNINDFEKLYDN